MSDAQPGDGHRQRTDGRTDGRGGRTAAKVEVSDDQRPAASDTSDTSDTSQERGAGRSQRRRTETDERAVLQAGILAEGRIRRADHSSAKKCRSPTRGRPEAAGDERAASVVTAPLS